MHPLLVTGGRMTGWIDDEPTVYLSNWSELVLSVREVGVSGVMSLAW